MQGRGISINPAALYLKTEKLMQRPGCIDAATCDA
jgi:hypothetical protein